MDERRASGVLSAFDDAVYIYMLSFLTPQCLDAVRGTSRRGLTLASDETIWKQFYVRCNIFQHAKFKRARAKGAKWTKSASHREIVKRMFASVGDRNALMSGIMPRAPEADPDPPDVVKVRRKLLRHSVTHPPEDPAVRFCMHLVLECEWEGCSAHNKVVRFGCGACGWAGMLDMWN